MLGHVSVVTTPLSSVAGVGSKAIRPDLGRRCAVTREANDWTGRAPSFADRIRRPERVRGKSFVLLDRAKRLYSALIEFSTIIGAASLDGAG